MQDILDGAGFSDVLTEVRDMNKAEKDEAQKEEDPPAAAEVAAASAEAGQGHNLPLNGAGQPHDCNYPCGRRC